MNTNTIIIDGMSCGHCIAAVQQALMATPGVLVARVALGSAVIETDSPHPAQVVSDAIHALDRAGYDARPAESAAAAALAPTSFGTVPRTHRPAHA